MRVDEPSGGGMLASFRYAINVMPKPGSPDPEGSAVEQSLPHIHVEGVHGVRIGRRIELTVEACDEAGARAVVDGLAREVFANPLLEGWAVEPTGAASSIGPVAGGDDRGATATNARTGSGGARRRSRARPPNARGGA